jgi:hypothetical protein
MRCLTVAEAGFALAPVLGADGRVRRGEPGMQSARFYAGAQPIANVYWVAAVLLEVLNDWEDAWLCLEDADTWKRQGLHLFNRLRLSYGETRLVRETPVH